MRAPGAILDPMTTQESTAQISDIDTAGTVPTELVENYRRDGFVRIRGALNPDEVEYFRSGAEKFWSAHRADSLTQDAVFTQLVNVWQQAAVPRELTLHPRIAGVAEQLAGIPLRVWHDQMLVKEPRSGTPTEFHQDRPYWPHADDRHSLSAWIALVDVPPERGCMTFLPGSHRHTGLRRQNLRDADDLFRADPELRWAPRVTVPLRAGDCTFHSSFTGHMALPNDTDLARLAHVTIYMDAHTTYNASPHPVTDPLELAAGARLDGETFPRTWG